MSPFVSAGASSRVYLGGVDITEFIRGLGGPYHLDPWQRSVLAAYSVPFETPGMRQDRYARLSRMRAAYRARHQ